MLEKIYEEPKKVCCNCQKELPKNWDINICPICEKLKYDEIEMRW